jgi:hypothetical protein
VLSVRPATVLSIVAASLVFGASAAACSLGKSEYSCTDKGNQGTAQLLTDIEGIATTTKAFVVDDCDSGGPRSVYFKTRDSSQLVDELMKEERCTVAEVASVEKGFGAAYDCMFRAGSTKVWVESDPSRGSNTAHLSSAG